MLEDTRPAAGDAERNQRAADLVATFDRGGFLELADQWARNQAAQVREDLGARHHSITPAVAGEVIASEHLAALPPERRARYAAVIAEQWRRGDPASGAPAQEAGTIADPVEHVRGELIHEATDLVIHGAGIDFAFHRTYRHQTIFDGPLGHRWDHAYNLTLHVDPLVARVWTGTGRSEGYRRHARWGTAGFHYYVPPDGVDATLEPIGPDPDAAAAWARRSPDGLRHIFEAEPGGSGAFRLARIEDRWGNFLAFDHVDGRLARCRVNHAERWVQFAYDEVGRIVRVFDFTGRTWRYVYDAHSDLVRVITPATPSQPRGSTTEYRYSSASHGGALAHNLTDIFDASGRHYLETRYGTSPGQADYNRVVKQRLGHGDLWFRYEPVDPVFPGELRVQDRPAMRCWVKERNGSQAVYTYNGWGGLLRKEETVKAPGHAPRTAIWRYRYNRDGMLVASRTPEGSVTHILTGRDHFLRVHGLETSDAEDDLWRHEQLTAATRRGFARILATVQRATVDHGGSVEWNERWGDVYAVEAADLVVKHTYEPYFVQLLTTSDPRATASPDPRASESPEYERLLTRYEYAGPSDAPTRDLVRIVLPRPTLPDGSLGDLIVTEILERDDRGRVTRARDATGTVTIATYHPPGSGTEATKEGFPLRTELDPGVGHLAIRTEYAIDALGRVTATTLPRGVASADGGFVVRVSFDALDRVISARRATPLDTETRTRYEPAGKPLEVETDWLTPGGTPEVVKRTFRYNEEHEVTRETWGGADQRSHFRIAHKYNASGTLRFTLTANDTSVHLRYDSRDQLVRTIRGRGTRDESTAEIIHDLDGRPVAQRSGEGRTTTTAYDAFGRAIAVTDPLGNVTRTSYDRAGRPTGRRVFERRGDGSYWLLSRGETVHDEVGRAIRARVNRFDAPLPATDLDTDHEDSPGPGVVHETQVFHDAAGRVVRAVDANGHAARCEYDAAGRLVTTIDPLGNRVEYRHDPHGNVIRKDRRDVVRDSAGETIGEEVFTWLGTYDERDRLINETDALGNVTSSVYDSLDRRVRTADPLGNVSEVTYDVHGRQIATIEHRTDTGRGGGGPLPSATVQFQHDRSGNLIVRLDALGRRTEYRHDRLDRPIEEILPDGARVATRYNRDDQVVATRDANGVVLRNRYDAAGRLARTDVDLAEVDAGVTIEGATFVEYTHDGLGRVRGVDNGVAATSTRYDSRGGAIAEDMTLTGFSGPRLTITRDFDAGGALTSLIYPSGRPLRFDRDERGQLRRISHRSDGTGYPGAPGGVRDLIGMHRVGDRIASIKRPSGVSTALGYDGAGRLVDIHHTSGGATTLRSQQLHDAARNPRSRIEAGASSNAAPLPPDRAERFGYDSQYQLLARAATATLPPTFIDTGPFSPATSPPTTLIERQSLIDAELGSDLHSGFDAWSYDLVGNRTSTTTEGGSAVAYVPDARDLYEHVDGVARIHDAAGNLLSDGTFIHRYDGWRRLSRVLAAATGTEIARYGYDSHGRRVIEEHPGEAPLFIVHDGPDRIADYRNDTLVALYAHGDDLDAPIHLATAGTDGWYHLDHQGTVRAVTDGDGKIIGAYRFDAFGNLLTDEGLPLGAPGSAASRQPFGFGARPFDPSVVLYDQRARSYSPTVGRFLQRDPARAVDGTNLYSFAGNHPVAFGDPAGLARIERAVAAGLDGLSAGGAALTRGHAQLAKQLHDPWNPASPTAIPDDFLGSGDPWSSRESQWKQTVEGWSTLAQAASTLVGDYLMRLQMPTMQRTYMHQPLPFEMQAASLAGDAVGYMAARDRYHAARWQYGGGVTVNTIIAYLDLAGLVNLPAAVAKGLSRPVVRRIARSISSPATYDGTRRVLKTPKTWTETAGLRSLGSTDRFGNVTVRKGMSLKDTLEALAHEGVHQWLSPSRGTVTRATASLAQRIRAAVRMGGYRHSHLLRFTEEALAEGIATRRIGHALKFAFDYNISSWRLAAEAGGVAGAWYGAYALVDNWMED